MIVDAISRVLWTLLVLNKILSAMMSNKAIYINKNQPILNTYV